MLKEEIDQYGLDHMLVAKKVLDDLQKYITEEKANGMAAWMAGPLAQVVDQISSCQNYDFSTRRIRG